MKKIIIVFCVLIPAFVFAQKQEQPSYFDGQKTVIMDYNTDFLFISGTNKQDFKSLKIADLNIDKNSLVLRQDNISKKVSRPKNFKKIPPTRIWTKLSLKNQHLSEHQYLKLLSKIKQDNPDLIVAPYLKAFDGEEVGLTNYVLVKLKKKEDFNLLMDQTRRLNLDLIGYHKYMPLWFTFSVQPDGMNILEAAKILHETELFEHAEPELRFNITLNSASKIDKMNLVPNDPLYPYQWHLNNTGQYNGIPGIDINAEAAWDIETGDPNIKTAIIDSGYEINHPDLNDNNIGADQVYGKHATACAGIVAAEGNNSLGVTGVAFNSSIMSISLDFDYATFQDLAIAINEAVAKDADILSNSWGIVPWGNTSILNNAIANALQNGRGGLGCVVVFAAGNGGSVSYPANSHPDILVLGAMSQCGERCSSTSCDGEQWASSYGPELDVVAPGVLIGTTDRQGTLGYSSTDYVHNFRGTSAACPIGAGVAALVLSANSALTGKQVNDIIEITAQKVRPDLYYYTNTAGRPNGTWNIEMGYGLVDAHAALLATNPCIPDMVLSGTISNTTNYEASNNITSTQTLTSTANVDYRAGNLIIMQPGFIASNGSDFLAQIDPCSNFNKTSHPIAEKPNNIFDYVYPTDLNRSQADAKSSLIATPNPFQSSTTLSFQLESSAEIDLTIFDLNGRKIQQLVTGNKEKGDHQYLWDSKGIPSGIYLARLILNDKIQTTRIVLTR